MRNEKERDYMVVKSNELIQKAAYRLTAEEQKFLCYVVSRIKPTDKDFATITVSAADYADLIGIDKGNAYRDFKKMADSFHDKARWIKMGDEVQLFQVFLKPTYNKKQGSLSVILDPDLKRHLLQLRSNYTEYELWNIISLKSKYAIRLYELFKSYAYQRETTFEIDNLKELLCCENYKEFKAFRRRVLSPAIDEINELTNLSVECLLEKTGQGSKVQAVTFKITKKDSLAAYKAYRKTADKINEKVGNIKGQYSLFDLQPEDFSKK